MSFAKTLLRLLSFQLLNGKKVTMNEQIDTISKGG